MPTPSKAHFLLGLLSLPLLFAQTAQRVIKIEDMHAFHDVRDPQISPDGKWVAYTVSTTDAAADKSDTDIWMASWDGAEADRDRPVPVQAGRGRVPDAEAEPAVPL